MLRTLERARQIGNHGQGNWTADGSNIDVRKCVTSTRIGRKSMVGRGNWSPERAIGKCQMVSRLK